MGQSSGTASVLTPKSTVFFFCCFASLHSNQINFVAFRQIKEKGRPMRRTAGQLFPRPQQRQIEKAQPSIQMNLFLPWDYYS